jgi:hypothetical protein
MEYWGLKADDNLIIFSAPGHPDKNRPISANQVFQSTKGGSSTFQYSITPGPKFTVQPISSDLVQRLRFSMLEKNALRQIAEFLMAGADTIYHPANFLISEPGIYRKRYGISPGFFCEGISRQIQLPMKRKIYRPVTGNPHLR